MGIKISPLPCQIGLIFFYIHSRLPMILIWWKDVFGDICYLYCSPQSQSIPQSFSNWKWSRWKMETTVSPYQVGILWKKISLNSLRFSLFRETETKKLNNFEKLKSLNVEIYIYTKIGHSALGNFIIQELKFWKMAHLFLCQLLSWEKIWENWENFFPQNPNLRHEKTCHLFWNHQLDENDFHEHTAIAYYSFLQLQSLQGCQRTKPAVLWAKKRQNCQL